MKKLIVLLLCGNLLQANVPSDLNLKTLGNDDGCGFSDLDAASAYLKQRRKVLAQPKQPTKNIPATVQQPIAIPVKQDTEYVPQAIPTNAAGESSSDQGNLKPLPVPIRAVEDGNSDHQNDDSKSKDEQPTAIKKMTRVESIQNLLKENPKTTVAVGACGAIVIAGAIFWPR